MPEVHAESVAVIQWRAAYESAVLDVLALTDVVDLLLQKRRPSADSRVWAKRRLERFRSKYPDPLKDRTWPPQFDGSRDGA